MSDTNSLVDAYGKAVLELEQSKNLIEDAEEAYKKAERDIQDARHKKHQILENLINARKKLTEELEKLNDKPIILPGEKACRHQSNRGACGFPAVAGTSFCEGHTSRSETGDLVKPIGKTTQEFLWERLIDARGGHCTVILQLFYDDTSGTRTIVYKVFEVALHNNFRDLGQGATPEQALKNSLVNIGHLKEKK